VASGNCCKLPYVERCDGHDWPIYEAPCFTKGYCTQKAQIQDRTYLAVAELGHQAVIGVFPASELYCSLSSRWRLNVLSGVLSNVSHLGNLTASTAERTGFFEEIRIIGNHYLWSIKLG